VRTAARIDANHHEVVAALRACGARVQRLEQGGGVPDLLVAARIGGRWWTNVLVEIKDGKKPPSERRLTPDQQAWIADWPTPVAVVYSAEDAVEWLTGRGYARNTDADASVVVRPGGSGSVVDVGGSDRGGD
jgi:hypothetical protein